MKGIRFRVKGLGFRFLYVVGMWFRFYRVYVCGMACV